MIDTKVTNEGMRLLRGSRKLANVRLDNSPGGSHLGGAALPHLADCPLRHLTLHGSAFGDKSAEYLQTFKQPKSVAFGDTSVTKAALDQLQSQTKIKIDWTTSRK